MARVCIFGDSITWGAWDFEHGGWPTRLRLGFDNEEPRNIEVYNVGISGDKVGDVLKRFDVEAVAREPEAIVLAIGINDSPHEGYEGTDLDEFRKRFEQLVEKSQAITKQVIIVGITNVKPSSSYSDDSIKQYDEVVKSVAGEKNLPFVDVFGTMTADDLKFDGLHPEGDGHQKIADGVRETLLGLK